MSALQACVHEYTEEEEDGKEEDKKQSSVLISEYTTLIIERSIEFTAPSAKSATT